MNARVVPARAPQSAKQPTSCATTGFDIAPTTSALTKITLGLQRVVLPKLQDDGGSGSYVHGAKARMAINTEPSGLAGSTTITNGETSRFRAQASGTASLDHDDHSADDEEVRPSSDPGRRNGAALSGIGRDLSHHQAARPVKPQLLRSKSDYVTRPIDEPDTASEEIPAWGARHGFEDHYQSEHIISQLANVSWTSLLPSDPMCLLLLQRLCFKAAPCSLRVSCPFRTRLITRTPYCST